MVTVGCGGNINPLDIYFRGEDPVTPGEEAAAEVERVLGQPMEPLAGTPQIRVARFDLPLQPAPGLAHWKAQRDWFSQTMTAQLKRGEPLATTIPYMVQTWTFSDDLNIVFLAGEVHVQYGLRLKEAFPGGRLWVNAYAHDSPAYIPAAEEIPEGGWVSHQLRRAGPARSRGRRSDLRAGQNPFAAERRPRFRSLNPAVTTSQYFEINLRAHVFTSNFPAGCLVGRYSRGRFGPSSDRKRRDLGHGFRGRRD